MINLQHLGQIQSSSSEIIKQLFNSTDRKFINIISFTKFNGDESCETKQELTGESVLSSKPRDRKWIPSQKFRHPRTHALPAGAE